MRTNRSLVTGIAALTLLAGSVIPRVALAADQSPAAAAAWVTGTIVLAPTCTDATTTSATVVEHQTGYRCAPQTWTTSDPRLTGTATESWDADVYQAEGASISVAAGHYDLHNEAGSWRCGYVADLSHGSGLLTSPDADQVNTCTGSGGYEGLGAVLLLDWTTSPVSVKGLIFPGVVPPGP